MVHFSDLSRDEQIIFLYQISNDLIIKMLSKICNVPGEAIQVVILDQIAMEIDMKRKKDLKRLVRNTRQTMQNLSNRQWTNK